MDRTHEFKRKLKFEIDEIFEVLTEEYMLHDDYDDKMMDNACERAYDQIKSRIKMVRGCINDDRYFNALCRQPRFVTLCPKRRKFNFPSMTCEKPKNENGEDNNKENDNISN